MFVAKRSFKYGTRRLSPGDLVEIRRKDARLLRALRWIADAPRAEPVRDVVDEAPKKRAYKRRDMKAEE